MRVSWCCMQSLVLYCPVQAPMSAHSSSPKNRGWALTWRRRLNNPTISVQAPTPDPKLADRGYWVDSLRSFARASLFRQTRPARQYRKLYPARKWTNPKSHSQGFAAFIACSMQISYCKQRTMRVRLSQLVCAAGCSGAWNSSKQSQTFVQEFCMVGGYTEDLTNHRTVKIGGWALAWGWALARDNTINSL